MAQPETNSRVGSGLSRGPGKAALEPSEHSAGRWPKSIRVVTDIPGPRSIELSGRAIRSVARPVHPSPSVFMARGRGALIQDVDANVLIDMTSGLGCLVVGHSHPKVVDAIASQAGRFTHTDFSVLAYENYVQLSERVAAACGGDRRVALFNSGAEAVENAVKVARHVTGRPGILCFQGAFHGRTYMAMSLTERESPYKSGFGPFSPDVHRLPYPGLNGATVEDFEAAAGRFWDSSEIAAAIVEPMLGEGGFVVPPPDFLPLLEGFCRRHGALLIVDEIQTGYGRTGRFLASDHFGVEPDLILLAKSIAAGLPLSAVVGREEIIDPLPPGSLGGTYVGNPIACAAALAVLDVIDEEDLFERAGEVGERLWSYWRSAASSHEVIGEVRGLGSMVGVRFTSRRVLQEFLAQSLRRGVLAVSAGAGGDVLRHLVPLVITDSQLDDAIGVFNTVLERLRPGSEEE